MSLAPNMNGVDIFGYLMRKIKTKQKKPTLELYSLLNSTYDFLADSNLGFQIKDNSFFMLFMI